MCPFTQGIARSWRTTEMLRQARQIVQLASVIAEARDVLYLGRGLAYPLALEGALKLKEISCMHGGQPRNLAKSVTVE
jgi:glutamine---fructose-6-phosphate transaminase (isomerizing)